jgi:bacillolysin
MFKRPRHLIPALALALLVTTPAFGQKPSADPRPLEGLQHDGIPRLGTVSGATVAKDPASLLRLAEEVGTGGISALPAPMGGVLRGAESAAKRSTPGSLIPAFRLERAPNGTVRWMEGIPGRLPAGAGKRPEVVASFALDILQAHAPVLRIRDPLNELEPVSIVEDELGYRHVRLEQVFKGIPVWGRDLYVHFDASGAVYAVNGTYEATPDDFVITPGLTSGEALATVIGDLDAQRRWAPAAGDIAARFGLDEIHSRMVFYPEARGFALAYEITLHPNLVERYTYLVDARHGGIINRIQRHCTLRHDPRAPDHVHTIDMPLGLAMNSSSASGTFAGATGTDLNGVAQNFRVFRQENGTYYKVWDLPNFDAATSKLPDEPAGGAVTISANNQDLQQGTPLFHVTSTNNTWTDPVSVSAHVNMNLAYNYFRDTHERKAIDGNDQSLISIIHITQGGQQVDNAFWNGRMMIYGNGREIFKPLAGALDVAGHEMSHGVIEHSANLVYQFQPGALNESFADVFGVFIDRANFLLGEQIVRPGRGVALRDLLNPDNPNVVDPQPAHMNQYRNLNADQDNGGVHINSGIPNRAAALIIQAIGHEKSERIYYRALTAYLTRNSQFKDARNAVEQAAKDLYGDGQEASIVRQAFDAVGITSNTPGNDDGGSVPSRTGGLSLIALMTSAGNIGLLNLTDPANPQAGLFQSPAARVRANPQADDRAQLSTPRSGERIWFVNPEGRLAFVDVQTGVVSQLPGLHIQQPGDLWNASVSPDENFVALVSAYANDPTIYIFNGEQLFALDLKPETSQGGLQSTTIQYPDVVSWSPNAARPRLAFDAFNAVPLSGGGQVSYWGIYELDLSAGRTFNLLPAQPSQISVGNITYSSSDANVVAFNSFENSSGIFDVWVADFSAGQLYGLDLPSYSLGGQPLRDAQRPTFAPDDSFMSFTSPRAGVILFTDLQTGELGFLDLGAPVFNPHWFMLGGGAVSTDPVTELPPKTVSLSTYPNPVATSMVIRYTLEAPADVQIVAYDLLGRAVGRIMQAPNQAGTHEVLFDVSDLASGVYVLTLRGQGVHATQKMVISR